jgi:hypothetical protein
MALRALGELILHPEANMTTVTQTTSNTIISLLGTVQGAATAVAKTVDSATSSIDILDRYVQRAKMRQIKSHTVEDEHWERNLLLSASRAQEKIETDLVREYSNDPARAQRFNAILASLEAKLAVPA